MTDLPIRPSQRRGGGRVIRRSPTASADAGSSKEQSSASPASPARAAARAPAAPQRPLSEREAAFGEADYSGPTIAAASQRASAPQQAASTVWHRQTMIAEAAYFRAVHRGFAPGRELEDWIAAERDIDAILERAQLSGELTDEATRGAH
jgi:hypothetical protein